MTKIITFKMHDPDEDMLVDMGVRAKRAYMFHAEQAFHAAWAEAQEWIRSGKGGTKEVKAEIHIADITYEPEPIA